MICMFVSPQINILKHNLQCDGSRHEKWFVHETGTLMNETTALLTRQRDQNSSIMWRHSPSNIYKPESEFPPDTESANTLIWDFLGGIWSYRGSCFCHSPVQFMLMCDWSAERYIFFSRCNTLRDDVSPPWKSCVHSGPPEGIVRFASAFQNAWSICFVLLDLRSLIHRIWSSFTKAVVLDEISTSLDMHSWECSGRK